MEFSRIIVRLHKTDKQELPDNVFPCISTAMPAFDLSKAVAMEHEGLQSWELSFDLPSEFKEIKYKFLLKNKDMLYVEEGSNRTIEQQESNIETQRVASIRLDNSIHEFAVTLTVSKHCAILSHNLEIELKHNEFSAPTDAHSSEFFRSKKKASRSVSIKDLVLLSSEASNAQAGMCPEPPPSPETISTDPMLSRLEEHQGLYVDRPPKLVRLGSEASMLHGDLQLEDTTNEDMPEAAGAVAAAAVAERMMVPKERRQLAIILVGLPARGKTFTATKLTRYLRWLGHDTKHFNVGKYRRLKHGCTQSADFFRADNPEGVEARNEVAALAMKDMLTWMEDGGQVGVFDATNSTKERRDMLLKMAEGKCKVFFLETICKDQSIIERNILLKIQQSPDYADATTQEAALADFKARLDNYEKAYEPVNEGSYIKMIDTVTGQGGQIQVNGISGYLPGRIVFFLVNTHITPRPILLTRHGESSYNLTGQIGGDPGLSDMGEMYASHLADFVNTRLKAETTASIWTSTLQRTTLTARHVAGFPKVQWRALDEINAGVCDGMTYEEIKVKMPDEYTARKLDKLRYRYPRGESYLDVIQRLEPVIIELERQRSPVVVIAHQAVLRSLYAYFADKPLKEIPHIEVPLHTVIEIQMGLKGIEERRYKVMEATSTSYNT